MSAHPASAVDDLLDRLAALDVRLTLDGERLKINAPKGTLSGELREELVTHRDAIKARLQHRAAPELRPVLRTARMPVAHTQQRLWFLRQMDASDSSYNISTSVDIRGPLDVAALQRTLDDLVRRHESLRMRFVAVDGTPYCVLEDDARAVIQYVDLSHLPEPEHVTAARQLLRITVELPFDLTRWPLMRVQLVRMGPEWHMFGLIVDHVVADGLSLGVLFEEMQTLYSGHVIGTPCELPPLTVQYVDYVQWQQEMLAAGAFEPHLTYWKEQLRGLPPVLHLPSDRARPRVMTHRGRRHMRVYPPHLAAELKGLARSERVTLYMLLLAAFQILLHRYSGETDFAVGTAVGARDNPALERVFGFFANNIVQRANLNGDPTVRELLKRVHDVALAAYAHQEMPFDLLVEAVAPRRDLDHSPLFQVLFVLHSQMSSSTRLGDAICTAVELPSSTSRFDLALDVFDLTEGLRTYFEFNTDLFDEATIQRMMDHFERLLHGMLADPEQRVSQLVLLSPEEQRHLLAAWRGALLPPPPASTVHGMVERQARSTPQAEALNFDGRSLTYAELDERANRLARQLHDLGIRRESLVGVYMERSAEMVVALLGTLKAGAAYVPLDPAFPHDRIEFMIGDAALAALLTQASLAAALDAGDVPVLVLDRDTDGIDEYATEPPVSQTAAVAASDLAYVIYTSGSTGRPKGVMIEHAAVVNFLRSMHAEPGITASDRLVSVTTLSFDIFGLELWGPLSAGGTVVLAKRATTLDGRELAELLEEQRATMLQATPATWRLLLESGWVGRAGLKMLCGGEALPRDLADRLLGTGGTLWNMYGPTETTIWSTLARIGDTKQPITIGRPIAATAIAVLEPSGQPAPPGVGGELHIGGAGVARGYLNRPELTSEKFVLLALDEGPPQRFYRTGDLARLRNDGHLEFIGRRDHQVKVRGFRIELGEIEAVLAHHPGVKENVVQVREDTPGDQRLVAYVVCTEGMPFDAEAARATLRTKLPEYMVPNHFVTIDALPLTPNGKVDRKSLPTPPATAAAPDEGITALMSPVEQRVAEIWREILGVQRIGLRDNFFDLGGHSLLLVRLQMRLQREFATELPLVELFQRTTVQAQAARLTSVTTDSAALQRARTRAEKQASA